jgi:hypothetical protein
MVCCWSIALSLFVFGLREKFAVREVFEKLSGGRRVKVKTITERGNGELGMNDYGLKRDYLGRW